MSTSSHSQSSRRSFLSLAGAAVATASLSRVTQADDAAAGQHHGIPAGATILFQGDSITDAGRNREHAGEANNQLGMGGGYASMAAANLLTAHKDAGLKIFNRGISGNKVFQLADRWQADCLDIKPDVLSVLIGVNDIWHKLNGNYDGTVDVYERDYKALLERTRQALPQVQLVVCEPFVLRCGAVKDTWFPEFDSYRAAAKAVAEAFDAKFVPFQSMFDAAIEFAPPEHWAKDGVHPSPHGAALMAHHWTEVVTG
ncbi:MAG: SGNH/GDSL hydrolase family protein [Planctomycetaceae bacterium]